MCGAATTESSDQPPRSPTPAEPLAEQEQRMHTKFEVIVIPASDVDRSTSRRSSRATQPAGSLGWADSGTVSTAMLRWRVIGMRRQRGQLVRTPDAQGHRRQAVLQLLIVRGGEPPQRPPLAGLQRRPPRRANRRVARLREISIRRLLVRRRRAFGVANGPGRAGRVAQPGSGNGEVRLRRVARLLRRADRGGRTWRCH